MKKTFKEISHVVKLCAFLLAAYIMIDIFDLPSRMGIPVQCINWDVASMLCGNLVVIALFAITYHALDKRNIQKEHNQRRVAIYMLRGTLMACCSQIKMLKDPRVFETLFRKIDFDKTLDDDSAYHKLLIMPFSDHDSIVSFASSGVLSEEEFSVYNEIRTHYRLLITTMITFFDVDEMKMAAERNFNGVIIKAEEMLDRM